MCESSLICPTRALGPRMLELAGETADGVLGWFYSEAYIERVVRPHLDTGARRAGRSLRDFDLSLGLPALVSDDPGARDLMRPYVVSCATAGWPSYERIMEVSGFGQAVDELRRRLARARHIEELASMVSDEMLDAFTLCGSATEVRARITRLQATGFTTLCLLPIPPGHFYPFFKGHFPDSLAVPEADLDGLRKNVETILRLRVPLT